MIKLYSLMYFTTQKWFRRNLLSSIKASTKIILKVWNLLVTLVLGSIRKGEDVHKTLLIWVDNMVTPGTEADVIISTEDVIARCLEVIALSGVIKS